MSPRRARAVASRLGDDPATALREHLIDTAERLLAERHVSAITTRDIARAAEVSDGVLYNYFADKNDLLLSALVRRYGGVLARFGAGLPRPGTATVEENLHTYARALLDLHAHALPIAAGLLTELPLLHRFIDAIHREPFGPHLILEPIADYLTGEERLGRLAAADVEAATTLLFGATIMLALSILMGRSPEDVAQQLPSIVRTLLRGLGPSPAGQPGAGA